MSRGDTLERFEAEYIYMYLEKSQHALNSLRLRMEEAGLWKPDERYAEELIIEQDLAKIKAVCTYNLEKSDE